MRARGAADGRVLRVPAAATARAMDALDDACQTLFSTLRRLAEGDISAQQFAALDALLREIKPRTSILDPLAMADHEETLSLWLTRHGVERDG